MKEQVNNPPRGYNLNLDNGAHKYPQNGMLVSTEFVFSGRVSNRAP